MDNIEDIIKSSNNKTETLQSLLSVALINTFSSIMISRAEDGYPIVYVNDAFTELTGYTSDEMIGKSPSVLQGPKTDLSVIDRYVMILPTGVFSMERLSTIAKTGASF